jgi:hypothetical protein
MNRLLGIVLALLLLAVPAFAACTTGIPYQTKADIIAGVHLPTDTYKIATHTSSATFGTASTTWSAGATEVSGTNYTTGGFALAAPTAALYTATGTLDFPDDVNNTITFTGGECSVVYNTSKSNKILFIQQHAAVSPAGVTLTYDFPAAGASTSFLRIARLMRKIVSPTEAFAEEGVVITIEGAALVSEGGM